VQLDTLIEGLEGTLGSAEIFTALFELELRGRVKQMPGRITCAASEGKTNADLLGLRTCNGKRRSRFLRFATE